MNEHFTFSKHAKERMKSRGITELQVRSIVNNPDKIIDESECKRIYQKKLNANHKVMLFRIFLNICKTPGMIITAYKTSKIKKYED